MTTTKTKHTPEPWIIQESAKKRNWAHWISDKNGDLICATQVRREADFNARLIIAAPAMLDTCKEVKAYFSTNDWGYLGESVMTCMKKVIKIADTF